MLGKSIRKRVLFALIFLSLVPLIAVAYQGYHCGRMAVFDLMRLHVISVIQARHAMIVSWLSERERDITSLVQQPVLIGQLERLEQGPDPAAREVLEAIVESVQSFEAPFESISILDAHWNVITSSTTGEHENDDIATLDFREQVRSTSGVFFDAAHLHDGREVGTHVGAAIQSPGGKPVGYLIANLNLTQSLTPILQDRSGLWRTGKAYLVDGSGRVITEPFQDDRTIAFNANAGPVQLEIDNPREEVQSYRDFFSHEVIGVTMGLPMQGWRLVVEIDNEEATRWVQILLFRVILMVSVALCAVLLVSTWMSRQLGQPLARLAAVAHRISAGHTDERVGPMHVKEAEEVRSAVNRMLDELRDKEAELVRTATLAAVGELTSSVVHEMRNPLSSIKMNLQSLRLAGNGDDQNRELADIAFDQAARLESMLNELLQYGRPLTLAPETVDVAQLLDSAVASVESVSSRYNVGITVDMALEDRQITVDVEQFLRVLINLLQNAIEASPRGGKVTLCVTASNVFEGGNCLYVLDEGPGFRAGHLEKLFKPFFTTKSNGIGLGLANVKKIVVMHGGTVAADNRESGGAVFQIDIPHKTFNPNSTSPTE